MLAAGADCYVIKTGRCGWSSWWAELQRSVAFDVVCAYLLDAGQDESGRGFTAICDLHTDCANRRELELRRVG